MGSVGVVVPCYKYGHFLADAIGSVLDDPGLDVRVLIIDDASPDDSAEQARALAAADPRIEVSVHPENRGHIRTYNEGLLDWCDADYAVLLSADDRLTPGSLRRAVDYLDANPGSGMVYGHYLRFDGTSELPPARTGTPVPRTYGGQEWLQHRFRHGNGCIASPEVVVRTAVQHAVGGYDPALPHTGDIEMWMRFAARADVGYLGAVDQAYYRVHGANMSGGWLGDAGLKDLQQRWAAYEALFAKEGDRVQDRAQAEARVRDVLAGEALWAACRAVDRGRGSTEPVAALVEFAESTSPDVTRLSEWRAWRLRQRVGADRMRMVGRLVPRAYWRRARQELWWRTWRRTGV